MPKPTIIFILGPTSSGKTKVAYNLAKNINGEIISCDSMQVYREMDIITQTPPETYVSEIPHHLIKILSPEKEYSAAKFREAAEKLINEVISRSKVPIITGGTGLYVKSLVDGLFSSPPKDEDFRNVLIEESQNNGERYLWEKLKIIDPATAEKLHPNDQMRIIRALEVFELTGEKISKKKMEREGISGQYDCKYFGLSLDRKVLYSRINCRVTDMFDEGIVEEVRSLITKDLGKTARKALGINEVSAYLDGDLTLDEAREELKKNTRRYAKRQLTWFRGDERIVWINADCDVDEIVKDIIFNVS
jgi:tRNA dimethylallyltransferase